MPVVMDPKGAARLREEQIKAIQETKEKLEQLNKYVADYVALRDRLKTLPDKISHDVMVPFGKFAFMPGHLVHTNEILVLLGDNWFCERSAKQASEIAERRIKALKKQMNDLEKQKGLLEPRLDFTTELQDILEEKSDVIEIKEDYDPEAEKEWRERHRQNVKAHKNRIRAEREKVGKKKEAAEKVIQSLPEGTDDALWRRLDELEVQERRNREMLLLSREDDMSEGSNKSTASSIPSQTGREAKKQVKWKDLHHAAAGEDLEPRDASSGSSDTESELTGSESDDSSEEPTTVITFKHTPAPDLENQKEEVTNQEEHETPLITSPADIYTRFACIPKSILKQPSETFTQNREEIQKKNRSHHVVEMSRSPDGPEPFTGTVLEKSPVLPSNQAGIHDKQITGEVSAACETSTGSSLEKSSPVKTTTGQSCDVSHDQKPTKKVSRFKARQMKKSL